MKGTVIYRSKYGATRQYAEWIAQTLEIKALNFDTQSDEPDLGKFIVICSSVYMGGLLIRDWIKKNTGLLQNKKLYLVVVCATPSSEKVKQEKILKDNIAPEILKNCEIFFFPGRLVIEKLSLKDRFILKVGALFVKDPARKAAMRHNIDGVKKEYINPLIKSIREYTSAKNTSL